MNLYDRPITEDRRQQKEGGEEKLSVISFESDPLAFILVLMGAFIRVYNTKSENNS